jgi:simple sugar transport system ATP-binding protein
LSDPALQLENVTRRFGAVVAVHGASAGFEYGRIHAVVGENGAGKSTLLGLAGGALEPSEGRVLVTGKPLLPATPAEAIRRGIGFVHQHFMLVEAFSALENILLGAEPRARFGTLDLAKGRAQARAVLRDLGMDLDLDARVADLGVGQRQNLEILRVLTRGATTILLDEPTAVLTPTQATSLFLTLRRMADAGACVVVVTHRLQEVLDHCQHVTVMRRGKVVSAQPTADTSAHALTCDIMGQEPLPPVERPDAAPDPELALELRGLCVAATSPGSSVVDDIRLRIPKGTILGVAGIEGNGQRELVSAIAGLLPAKAGQILLEGQDVSAMSVAKRRDAGLSVVHDDRHREGLMLDVSVSDNLVLGDLGTLRDEPGTVARRMLAYGIVPDDPRVTAGSLSGGNQQKVVVARALDRGVCAVVLAQPTRGVDLGAARAIHEAICKTAQAGAGVLIVSADLAELRAICHEVAVMARGRIVTTLPPDTSEVEFGRAMLGEVVS